ncbi:transcription initiation factor TFIID subunit 12-like isoform X2 [Phragmites australis]|uniref:transcription initiation factor TFIID subunit 12-like isoform X2 n=1 Tax=Phragmites australis TaxID=29695 RepID=UPI002D78D908|nr:transcription initiation factor TFIID subunit 12-like isoform X2 [Phragmites australis]
MDAPPSVQPDAAVAAAAAAPSSISASAPSQAPPSNPPTSATTAIPPASVSTTAAPTPNPGTTLNPAQTLEGPAPSPAAARPLAPRMRPPYTHLASPITMSSSSSAATSAASSSATAPTSSPAASTVPRGGVVIGMPAPRPAQTPVGYTGFVPPPPLAHQFGSMHRGPDQAPLSSAQPSPGIQNIGMVGSLNTTQMRPGAISGPQQPRPGLPSSTTPIPSGSQMPGSQRTPAHTLTRPMPVSSSPLPVLQQTLQNASSTSRPQQRPQLRPQQSALVTPHQQNVISSQQQQQQLPQHQLLQQQKQQLQSQQQSSSHQNQQNSTLKNQQQLTQQLDARTPVSMAQKPDSPAMPNAAVMRSVDTSTDADASETGNRLLTKRSIQELVAQIDPNEKLDPEVEDVLIDIAEDFVESVATFACSLAKHRKSNTLEAKDVLLHAEKSWNITLPGFSGDEIKLYKKQHVNDIHRERLALIKKSVASDTKNSAAQAAANHKNQTPKPPAPASP